MHITGGAAPHAAYEGSVAITAKALRLQEQQGKAAIDLVESAGKTAKAAAPPPSAPPPPPPPSPQAPAPAPAGGSTSSIDVLV